jgi:hypothetical protein
MTEVEVVTEEARDALIYDRRVRGDTVRSIAEHFRLSIAEINSAIDRRMPKIDNAYRARAVALSLDRLDALETVYQAKALDGDHPSAFIVLRIEERRGAILGTDSPIRVDPIQLIEVAGPKPNSTEELRAALPRLRANGAKPAPPPAEEEPPSLPH